MAKFGSTKALKPGGVSDPARWRTGAAYVPLIKVQSFSSKGRVTRLEYQGRVVHLLSDLEVRAFRHFQWNPAVVGLEEQYGLEVDDTLRIARDMGVRHPVEPGTTDPNVMTTDLVVYFAGDRGERRMARSMKYSKDVEPALAENDIERRTVEHTIEKLEIERRYWAERGVDWALLTERELSDARKVNIEHLLDVKLPTDRPEGFWQEAAGRIRDLMIKSDGARVKELQRELNEARILDSVDFTLCFRYLCATRQLTFDMEQRFSFLRPVSDFSFSAPGETA